MNGRVFLYGLWCLGVVGLFMTSSMFAWSPFAEGGKARPIGGIGGGYYGPTHK